MPALRLYCPYADNQQIFQVPGNRHRIQNLLILLANYQVDNLNGFSVLRRIYPSASQSQANSEFIILQKHFQKCAFRTNRIAL